MMNDVPSKGTPRHTIRVPDEIWLPFVDACAARGQNASEVIRECIRNFMVRHDDKLMARALEVADKRGDNLESVLTDLLTEYINDGSSDPAAT